MVGFYWWLVLLMLVSCTGDVKSSVFYQKNKANRVLRIQKRANWFWEEVKAGSLERECIEESCSFEEAEEIYKSHERTVRIPHLITAHGYLNACNSSSCRNDGLCKVSGYSYICLCPPLWKGEYCEIASETALTPPGEFDKLQTEVWEEKVLVKKFLIHPQYDPIRYDNDIALLYLNQPVNFCISIAPICLPNHNLGQLLLQVGKVGTVSGWGLTHKGGRSSRFLRRVQLPYIEQEVCIQSTNLSVTDNMFGAGFKDDNMDSCHGNSGGPYAVLYRQTWYLIGIISWGEGCARAGKYGVYTRVPGYLSWIYDTLSEYSH
ncbi:coagulation factor X-like [Cetorhinus maximus]